MKRWLYIGGGVLLGVLLLIAIALYFLFSSLDSIVKAAVEKYGSDMTQAVVKLQDVDIEITAGKGALKGLTVGNPPGFKSERALSLGEISLQLDVGSVTKEPIVINELSITAPEVTYELGVKGNNIDALRRNVDAYTSEAKDKPKAAEGAKGADKEATKMVVEYLYIRNGRVNVSATELRGKTAGVPLPEIHLTAIGRKTGGATAGELAAQVLAAISREAAQAAASTEIGKLVGAAPTGKLPGAAGEAAGEAGESLKKLFGK